MSISTNDMVAQANGFTIPTAGNPLELTLVAHGDIVRREWHVFGTGAGIRTTVITTILKKGNEALDRMKNDKSIQSTRLRQDARSQTPNRGLTSRTW
jgi:hypothetical protein